MVLKTRIGERLREVRKEQGLTLKELAAKTINLKPSRIANWEQGTRMPGPLEAKQLSQALRISPAYLLCLTDDEELFIEQKGTIVSTALPLLTLEAIASHNSIEKAIESHESDNTNLVPIQKSLASQIGITAFAALLADDSMAPEFRNQDLVIIDPHTPPKPSNFVLAKPGSKMTPVLRKYREVGMSENGKPIYELEALHRDWSNLKIDAKNKVKIIGTVVLLHRNYIA